MHDEQTVIVTGASGGIGRTIALQSLEEGSNVTLAARSDGIEETAELADSGSRALPVRTDVTDESAVKNLIERTVDAFGA